MSKLGNKNSLRQTIEFLHSIKLIRTDLKPENVLLTSWDEREVKLYSGDDIKVPAAPHIKRGPKYITILMLWGVLCKQLIVVQSTNDMHTEPFEPPPSAPKEMLYDL